ncbi:hypothetical protein J2X72_001318 [Phyllobacterium sp. 1468]|nr:hypothetical protein [Phyllobacterium sp. 1468]
MTIWTFGELTGLAGIFAVTRSRIALEIAGLDDVLCEHHRGAAGGLV